MAEETLVPNPFHFGSPAEGPNFTDRDRELGTLTGLMLNGQNAILIAPRRFGKSSLLLRAIEQVRAKGGRTGKCSLMRCSTEREVANELLKAVVEGPAGWLHGHLHELTNKLRALRITPDFYFDEEGKLHVRPYASSAQANWKDVIADVVRVLDGLRDDRHPVSLVIDEFQKATEINPSIGDQFKDLVDELPHVSLVLAGSKRHLMEALVNNPGTSPLYQVGAKIYLTKISREDMIRYLKARAEDGGKSLDDDIAGAIYDAANGVPNDVQLVAFFAFQRAKRIIDQAAVDAALLDAVGDHKGEFERVYDQLASSQQLLLKVIARELKVEEVTAKPVLAELTVNSTAARKARDALSKLELIVREDGAWRIYAGLFRLWLLGAYD